MADTDNDVRSDRPDRPDRPDRGRPRDETRAAHRSEALSEAQSGEFDKDVNISSIVWSGVILTAITALSFLLMWWLFQGLKSSMEARDPEPLPIEEAARPIEPPGPRLQAEPEEDLRRMREQEDALLESYSLLRGEEGYARIPVDEALDLALELRFEGEAGGMSAGPEAVEAPGTATPEDVEAGDEDAGASNADSPEPAPNRGTSSPSPRSTRSR